MTPRPSVHHVGLWSVTNGSSRQTREVLRVVRFVLRDLGLYDSPRRCRIVIKDRPSERGVLSGRYWHGLRALCRITPRDDMFPRSYKSGYDRRSKPPAYTLTCWQDALVSVLAHELEHHRQHLARKRFAESDTMWMAYRVTRRWQEHEEKRQLRAVACRP